MKCLVIGLAVAALSQASVSASPANGWTFGAPMPNPRSGAAVALLDGRIYVIGGWAGQGDTDWRVVQTYDIASGRWSVAAPLPVGVQAPAAAAFNGKIYVFGGFTGALGPFENVPVVSSCWSYDPKSDRWSSIADLPSGRGAAAAAVLRGEIHIVGGADFKGDIDAHDVYDPAKDAWRPAAPLPSPRDQVALVADPDNGKLYAIGGWDDTHRQVTNANDAYDPASDSWSANAPVPGARAGPAAVYLDGKIVALGGWDLFTVLKTVETYDAASNRWSPLPSMPASRTNTGAVVSGHTIYVPGGAERVGIQGLPVKTLLTFAP